MRVGRLTELLGVPLNERGGMALKLSIARGRLRRRVRQRYELTVTYRTVPTATLLGIGWSVKRAITEVLR